LEFLEWARKKKNCYFIGMGDYDDLISTSEREGLSGARLHDSTLHTIEDVYRRHTDRLVKEVAFMKGKLIGLIEGNHYATFINGTTSTQRMCQMLDCKYLGCSTFTRLVFENRGTKRLLTMCLDVWAHHGKGAARLVGGSMNRVQQMAEAAEADIYIMGHDHRKGATPVTRLRLTNGGHGTFRLTHRKMMLIRSGSFLRGYVPENVSYIADGAMNPTDLGVVKLELTPRRDKTGGQDISYMDIHANV